MKYEPRTLLLEMLRTQLATTIKQNMRKQFLAAIRKNDALLDEIVIRNNRKFDATVREHIGTFTGSDKDLLASIRIDEMLFESVVGEEFECLYQEIDISYEVDDDNG